MFYSLFFCASAFGAAAPDDLIPDLKKLNDRVVVGVIDPAVARELRQLDRTDFSIELDVLVLAPGTDAVAALRREMGASGISCAAKARQGVSTWTLEPLGSCAPIADVAPAAQAAPGAVGHTTPSPAPVATPVASSGAAPTPPPPADPYSGLAMTLSALPDSAARRAELQKRLTSASEVDAIGRLSTAIAVVNALDVAHRSDPTIVRWFLEGALSPDPAVRQRALDGAKTGGDPPMPGAVSPGPTAPAVAVSTGGAPKIEPAVLATRPAPSPAALREYASSRLVRDKLQMTTFSAGPTYASASSVVTWTVYDGGGSPFTAPAFAQLVHDRPKVDQMSRERRVSWGVAVPAFVVGTAGFVVGFRQLEKDEPSTAAMYGGFTLGFAGEVLAFAPYYIHLRQQFVPKYYTPAQADAKIDVFNAALREKLGLSEDDVAEIDLGK